MALLGSVSLVSYFLEGEEEEEEEEGEGGYKEERTCGVGLTIPLNLEQRRLDGM